MKVLLSSPLRAGALLLIGYLLAGCAALRVDVDVYKGPLANTDETQVEQLASMALSAKPLILTMRNSLLRTIQIDVYASKLASPHIKSEAWQRLSLINAPVGKLLIEDDRCRNEILRNARYLNGILSFYQDKPKSKNSDDSDSTEFDIARPQDGVETLVNKIHTAQESRRTNASHTTPPDGTGKLKLLREDLSALLVDMAARIQFFATFSGLVAECQPLSGAGGANSLGAVSKTAQQISLRIKPLLETIANTILVQADETRRKDEHPSQSRKFGGLEREAARRAFGANPSRVYDQMLADLDAQQRSMAVLSQEAAKAALAKESPAAKAMEANLTTLKALTEDSRTPAVKTAMLMRTLGVDFPKPRSSTAISVLLGNVLVVDGMSGWVDDSKAISSRFATGKMSTTDAVKSVAEWFEQEISSYRGRSAFRLSRLIAANEALKSNSTTTLGGASAMSAPAALAEIKKVVAKQFQDQFQQLERRYNDLHAAPVPASAFEGGALSVAKADPPKEQSNIATADDAKAVSHLLIQVRDQVFKALGGAGVQDAEAIPTQIRLALEAEKLKQFPASAGGESALASLSKGNFDKAISYASRYSVSVSSLPDYPTKDQPSLKPIDTADAVIALLRNQHIEAILRGGRDGDEARNIAAALTQAVEYRTSMVYVHSASAYLRSALPATFLQASPLLGRSNILLDPIRDMAKSALGEAFGLKHEQRSKEEVDKAFWQNINTVRVTASGSSNFVLAKDDVGNWYVKAMGADPKAMVNAAKNLALFNMSGKFDSNLLRINQLQTNLDADSTESSEEKRGRWKTEMDDLRKDTKESRAVPASSAALALFQRNYEDLTSADATELRDSVKALPAAIKNAWQSTLRDDLARLPVVEALTSKFVTEVTAALDNKAAATTGDQIIAALKLLDAYRFGLTAKVKSEGAMTAAELGAVDTADKEVRTREDELKTAETALKAAADAWQAARAAVTKDSTDPKSPALVATADKAEKEFSERLNAQIAVRAKLADARQLLTLRQGALTAAKMRQSLASENVNQVLRPFISSMVAKRLRTVQELETATNVIGRGSL